MITVEAEFNQEKERFVRRIFESLQNKTTNFVRLFDFNDKLNRTKTILNQIQQIPNPNKLEQIRNKTISFLEKMDRIKHSIFVNLIDFLQQTRFNRTFPGNFTLRPVISTTTMATTSSRRTEEITASTPSTTTTFTLPPITIILPTRAN